MPKLDLPLTVTGPSRAPTNHTTRGGWVTKGQMPILHAPLRNPVRERPHRQRDVTPHEDDLDVHASRSPVLNLQVWVTHNATKNKLLWRPRLVGVVNAGLTAAVAHRIRVAKEDADMTLSRHLEIQRGVETRAQMTKRVRYNTYVSTFQKVSTLS